MKMESEEEKEKKRCKKEREVAKWRRR